MNRILSIIFLITEILLFVSPVFARNGIYMTVESGVAIQPGLPSAAAVGAMRTQTYFFPTAWRAAVGYNHDLYESFGIGLDVGYGYEGKKIYYYPTYKYQVSSQSLEFLALTQWHVNPQWDVIAKIGGIRQTVEVSGPNAPANETQISPEINVGIAYNFNLHTAVTASYAHVFGQQIANFTSLRNKTPSISEWLIGLRYTF